MSWFARSIANTFKLDDGEDNEQYSVNKMTDDSNNQKHEQQIEEDNSPQFPGRGVKEDLSEITETLTRQFWGVASFLAPPVPSGHSNERSEPSDPEASAPERISGIRRDFAEIGGKFRSGISKLSNNIDVSEITKMASDFLQLESEDEDYVSTDSDGDGDGAVGVTDEVVAFARDIAMHPETWLDFPLPEDEDDDEDFHLSAAQQDHALAVENLVPRLGALKMELCPRYMTESSFWKIYFVLLHPRLEHHAAKLLSTPKIVRTRALLALELKNRQLKNEARRSNSAPESSSLLETVKHPIESDEIKIVDKSVIKEEPHELTKGKLNEDDPDEWLKEENSEVVSVPVGNDEDVSFSDLEDDDDDDGNIPIHYKRGTNGSDLSRKESEGWIELGRSSTDSGTGSGQVNVHNNSESKECNDWHDVVDIDVL